MGICGESTRGKECNAITFVANNHILNGVGVGERNVDLIVPVL